MLALCIALIFVSVAFSSEDTVNIFGANIYIVNKDGIATVPKGSAVIVNPCAPYEVEAGKLVLYKKDDELSLGYGKDYSVSDGVYQITVIEDNKEVVISETNLIGKADYASEFLGNIITFIKKPVGVLCLAVIPCLVLIFYDIIRAFALKRPLPEVIPQVKNKEPAKYTDRGISVNADGKGTYSRINAGRSSNADEILFSYAAKQKKPERKETPIIPLTDRTKPETASKPVAAEKSEPKKNAGAMRPDVSTSKTGKFEKVIPPENKTEGAKKKGEASPKPVQTDAFFTQSLVPQIQKSAYLRNAKNNNDETGNNDEEKEDVRPLKISSKRSTEIIANKNVEELMFDDDDIRDRSRYNDVDEIISGLNKKV